MNAFGTLAWIYNMPAAPSGETVLNDSESRTRALNQFLASVELKAYKIAQASLRHPEDAHDAVQDAMMQLARAYAARPADEWKPLFYRILGNRIRDMQRRRAVRRRLFAWLPFRQDEEDEPEDPIDRVASPEPQTFATLEMDEAIRALDAALQTLPQRQREAFLLRNLEGLDVAETAIAMNCSEGTVKTHYFRAVQALRAQLGEFEP